MGTAGVDEVVLTKGFQVLAVAVCPHTSVATHGTVHKLASQHTHGYSARALHKNLSVAARAGEATVNLYPLAAAG